MAMSEMEIRLSKEAAWERVRFDRGAAPTRLRPLLEVIERDVFDPQLDVQQIFRRAGIRDRSLSAEFKRHLGRTPRRYLEDRRLGTALRLILHTRLELVEVAATIGYSSLTVFSRAFKRWSGGIPPSHVRKRPGPPWEGTGARGGERIDEQGPVRSLGALPKLRVDRRIGARRLRSPFRASARLRQPATVSS